MTNDTPCGAHCEGETDILTDWGLSAPGAAAVFNAYVALTTGNEKGGNAVAVRRPEG